MALILEYYFEKFVYLKECVSNLKYSTMVAIER